LDAQILSRCKKPKYTLGPRLDATVRLFRGLTGHKATFASLEVSPPRPLVARHISASPKGEGSPSERRRTPSHSRPPRPSPPQGLGAGGLRLIRDPLSRLGLYPNYPMGLAHLLVTTPRYGAGVRRRQQPRRTADMIGVPSACSCHCASIPGAVRTCLTLHHHSRRHAHSARQREPPTVLS